MNAIRFTWAFAAVAIAASVVVGRGQDDAPIPGRWAPERALNRNLDGAVSRAAVVVTPAQAAELQAVVARVNHIFHSTGVLNPPPNGFELALTATTDWFDFRVPDAVVAAPIPQRFQLLIFRLFRECPTCTVRRATEADGYLNLFINDVEAAVDATEPKPQRAGDLPWWVARRVMGQERGVPVYEGGFGAFIFTASDRPVGLPVSQAEYLDRLIRWMRASQTSATRAIAAAPDEQRRALAEMERTANELSKSDPAAARDLRRAIEETRRTLAAERPQADTDEAAGLKATASLVAELERELASLTPAERAAPAIRAWNGLAVYGDAAIAGAESREPSSAAPSPMASLRVPGEDWGRRVVTLNPNFFDRSAPRTRPQILVMQSGQGGDPTGAEASDPEVFALRRALHRTLDWSAVRALVRR